jgi:hypothetical protein
MVISLQSMYKHNSLSFFRSKIYQYGICAWFISRKHSHKELLIRCPQGSGKNIYIADVIGCIIYVGANEQMNVYGHLKQKQ